MILTLVFMTTEVKLPMLDGRLVCNIRQIKKGAIFRPFFLDIRLSKLNSLSDKIDNSSIKQ
tara:strand:+ start:31 stop:213 length:183 start_codon:yes stop_codon:yes gene_type:complete